MGVLQYNGNKERRRSTEAGSKAEKRKCVSAGRWCKSRSSGLGGLSSSGPGETAVGKASCAHKDMGV